MRGLKYNSIIVRLLTNKYEILVLIFSFIFLYPILNSGYYFDDIHNSASHGVILNNHGTTLGIVFSNAGAWFNIGRVFPLGFFCYAMFDIFSYLPNPVLAYKIFLVIVNLISILVLGIFVEKLTKSKKAKLLCMLISALFFQVTVSHYNAIYSFHGLLQSSFILGTLSLIFVTDAVNTGKNKYKILSAVFLCLALLTYEVGFAFIIPVLLIPFILIKKDMKKCIKSIIPQAVVIVGILIINVYARMQTTQHYNGVSVDLSDLYLVAKTFLKQFIAALPLTQTFLNEGVLANAMRPINVYDIIVLVSFAVLGFFIYFKPNKQETTSETTYPKNGAWLLVLIGLLLWIIPSALIAVTQRYQAELHFGIAHLPVYVESFGVIFLIAGCFLLVKKKFRLSEKRPVVFILLLAVCLPVLYINVKTMNAFFDDSRMYNLVSRNVTEQAIKKGFYDDQNEKNMLLFDSSSNMYSIPNENIFASCADVPIKAAEIHSYISAYTQSNDIALLKSKINNEIVFTKPILFDQQGGIMAKGNIAKVSLTSDEKAIEKVLTDNVQVFVSLENYKNSLVLTYNQYINENEYITKTVDLRECTVTELTNQKDKLLFIANIDTSEGLIDLLSLAIG